VELFGRHKTSAELTTALVLLTKAGLARCEAEPTGGRPGERWFTITSKGGANA
jgi:DNA-binding PadR family transcriptional regulator